MFGAITLGMLYWANANPGWLALMVAPLVSAIFFGVYLPLWLVWVGSCGGDRMAELTLALGRAPL